LTGRLGMPAAVPVLLTCVAVPLVNYIMLGRWVFRDA
ncbi:MAG: GtrA family protein, partial [Mesorhizobium sp.]